MKMQVIFLRRATSLGGKFEKHWHDMSRETFTTKVLCFFPRSTWQPLDHSFLVYNFEFQSKSQELHIFIYIWFV